MKIQFVIICLLISWASISSAWKEIGNGAGISEQNIIYAKENAGTILANAASFTYMQPEKDLIRSLITELGVSTLKFEYDNDGRDFEIDGNVWTIRAANLESYDQDGNGILSLKESYAVLLDIYAMKYSLNSASFQENRDNVLSIIGQLEKTLVLKNFGVELQWTEVSGIIFPTSIFLFYAGTPSLQFTPNVYSRRLCDGDVTNIRLINPALANVQKQTDSIRLLIMVDAYYDCDGKAASKRLPIGLLVKNGQLHQF